MISPEAGHSRAVHIQLIDGAAIRRDGAVATLPAQSRAAVALARAAVGHNGAVTRDELADAVWGDSLPPTWKAALRNVVADVRGALGAVGLDYAFRAVDGGYRLELEPGSTVDVLRLEEDCQAAARALESGDEADALRTATEAVALAGRPLLPGAQAEWVDRLRDRIAELRGSSAVTGAEAALALDDLAVAERLAAVAVDVAPAREDGHRLLIRALAASGNRGAALAAYERCRDVLEHDFGTRPSDETEQLRREVLAAPAAGVGAFVSAPAIGAWRRSADYGLRVARTALDAAEFDDSVAAASRALGVLASAGDPDPVRRLELEIVLGAAQRALGDGDGFATLDRAVVAARQLGDAERLADAALAFAHSGAASEEVFVDARMRGLYEEALSALGDRDDSRRARLLGHLAAASALERGHAHAREPAHSALALASTACDDRERARVLTTVRRALTGYLDLTLQERIEDELLLLAEALDDPGAQARALLWRFHTRVEEGRGDEAEALLEAADRVAAELRMPHYHHTIAYTRAALALLRGDHASGERLLQEAAELGHRRGLDAGVVEAIRLTQLVGLRHEQGRAAEVRDEAMAVFGAADLPPWLGMVALVESESGNADAAQRAITAFVESYARTGSNMLAPVGVGAYAAHPIARLGSSVHARKLYSLLAPFAGRSAYFAYFAGPVDLALGLLARTLGRPDDALGHFEAAGAICERLGAPLWTERCREYAVAAG